MPTIGNINQLAETGFDGLQHILVSLVFFLAVYGPLVGAVVAARLEEGQVGVRNLLRAMGKWQVGLKWYVVIVAVALILPLVPFLVGILTGLHSPANVGVAMFLPLLVFQLMTSGLGEEPGWRGYLLPRLQERFAARKAVWALGLVWAAWHYPFTIFDTLSNAVEMPVSALVMTIGVSQVVFTLTIVGITYLYVWFYNHTQSVFLAILFHALTNVFQALLLASADMTLSLMQALMPWVLVIVLERAFGKNRFPGAPVPRQRG